MSKLKQLKKDLENYYGLPLEVDENSTIEEWSSAIQEVEDFLSNEISDKCKTFHERMVKAHSETLTK